jgi:hypothetical protein
MKGLLRVLVLVGLVWVALTSPGLSAHAQAPSRIGPSANSHSGFDFDGDGVTDLARLAPSGALTVRLTRASQSLNLSASVVGFAVSDLDHDGDPDIVALSATGNLQVWYNRGDGRFRRERVSVEIRRSGWRPAHEEVSGDPEADNVAEPVTRGNAADIAVPPQPWIAATECQIIDLCRDRLLPAPRRSFSSPRAPPFSSLA